MGSCPWLPATDDSAGWERWQPRTERFNCQNGPGPRSRSIIRHKPSKRGQRVASGEEAAKTRRNLRYRRQPANGRARRPPSRCPRPHRSEGSITGPECSHNPCCRRVRGSCSSADRVPPPAAGHASAIISCSPRPMLAGSTREFSRGPVQPAHGRVDLRVENRPTHGVHRPKRC
jgi:hypothetical protein